MSLWQPATESTTLHHHPQSTSLPVFLEAITSLQKLVGENLILCPLFRLFSHYPGIVQFRKNVALEII